MRPSPYPRIPVYLRSIIMSYRYHKNDLRFTFDTYLLGWKAPLKKSILINRLIKLKMCIQDTKLLDNGRKIAEILEEELE